MSRKCHNHRLQTDPLHHDEETQHIDSYITIQVKQPVLSLSKMIAELEDIKSHIRKQWSNTKLQQPMDQQQSLNIQTTFHLFLDIFIVNETDLLRTNLLFTIFI